MRIRYLCLYMRNVLCSLFLPTGVLFYLHNIWSDRNSLLNDLSLNALGFMHHKVIPENKISSAKVRFTINKNNQEEKILNLDKFGNLKRDMIVFVIQVNKYREEFKYLLASLCEVIGIEDTLLIFSHSYLDNNVNKLIQSIDFCRVLQIFYPYSLQAYPHEFSDHDARDCTYDKNCTGAFTPDMLAQYRQREKIEKKHFWWWTANKVFQNLSCIERNTGVVVFIDDDLYLMQDFLYMIYYMRNVAKSFPQCEILSIMTDPIETYNDVYRVEVASWDPRHHSSVVAFDMSLWKTIVAHYDLFCTTNESSWSRSLLYLSLNRRPDKMFKVVYSTIPRAIRTSCSNGILKSYNRILDNVLQALIVQRTLKKYLFPPYLEVYTHIEIDNEGYLGFDVDGGWNDPRDMDLCKNITSNKVMKLLTDMELQFLDYDVK